MPMSQPLKGAHISRKTWFRVQGPPCKTATPRYKTVKPRYKTVKLRYKTVMPRYKTVMPRYKTVKPKYKRVNASCLVLTRHNSRNTWFRVHGHEG